MSWMPLPTGRKLEQPGHDPNHVGTLSVFRRADAQRLAQARKRLHEVHIEEGQQGLRLREKSGQEWEICTAFYDPVDPKASGVEAFCVRDNLIVPLRPVGWQPERESRVLGEVGGREAGPREPMPVSGIR